jgi:uncharacterized YkwD family protein
MKRFGTITIAMALGLGFVFAGFSNTASAAASFPLPNNGTVKWVPYTVQYQYQVQPYMFQQYFANQPVQPQTAPQKAAQPQPAPVGNQVQQPAPAPANQANKQVDASAFAKKVAELVNQERAKAGLSPLKMDAALSNLALAKAADMSNNNYFDHTSPTYGSPFDMMKQYGISYNTAGENLAMGQRSPEEVMTQWMNSEGHRKNIMNPSFTTIGVGYTNGYWVQEFIG